MVTWWAGDRTSSTGSNFLEDLHRALPTVFNSPRMATAPIWKRSISPLAITSTSPTQRLLANVTDHHLEVFRGRSTFAYSAPKGSQLFDVRRHFGIRNDQKMLLATMSSYDEDMAAELAGVYAATSNPLFGSQIEWVRALLDFVNIGRICFS
ncbi:MAG: hypothetical protein WDN48_11450 [Pseudolabrys sp.]